MKCLFLIFIFLFSNVSFSATIAEKPNCEIKRDSSGRIKRSSTAKTIFKRSHPCPSTGARSGKCPGYVIDHIIPLKRCGLDTPINMQWQTIAEAKAKDRWE